VRGKDQIEKIQKHYKKNVLQEMDPRKMSVHSEDTCEILEQTDIRMEIYEMSVNKLIQGRIMPSVPR